jgi:hypothetical protein
MEIIAAAKEKDLYHDLARFLPKHYRQTITDLKKNILQKLEKRGDSSRLFY